MRAPNGNSILHEIMTEGRPMYEFELETRNNFDIALPLICEANHQGQTPCHALWRELNSSFIDMQSWMLKASTTVPSVQMVRTRRI